MTPTRRAARVLAAAALLAALALGGCGARQVSLTPVEADGYSARQICDYFCEIAFESEYGGARGFVCKWTKEIVVRVEGEFGEGETAVLDDLCTRLGEIPGFPGIRYARPDEEANFTVHFVMQNELSALFGDAAVASSGMSRFYYGRESGEIRRAEAGIATNITPQSAKASVICEEFLQSLGLAADSYSYPESVFYEGYNVSLRPAAIDWAVLEVLYSEAISPRDDSETAAAAARRILGITEDTP